MRKINKMRKILISALTIIATVTFFLQPAVAAGSSEKTPILVSAAASTTDALNEIIKQYEAANPDVDIIPNYGSSGALAKQIVNGGRADLFLSASPVDMATVEKAKMVIATSRINLLQNRLVVIVPKDMKYRNINLKIASLKDLSSDKIKKIALGEPQSVPAGRYAMEAAKYYKADKTVTEKAVYAKDVRQVLNFVESGNVDCGFVYQTDAFISKKVGIAFYVPTASHAKIVYPAALLTRGTERKAAEDFLRYLQNDSSKKIFKKFGFLTY
jgi:molybdate transport system substrate-binding protein